MKVIKFARLMALAVTGVFAFSVVAATVEAPKADTDFQPIQALGVDQSVDYASLSKFGPWDDRNYQLRAEDLRILPDNDRYVPGVPAFFKVMKRKEMIEQGFPLETELYPREFDKEYQYRFGGLMQGGKLFLTERGKNHYKGPENASAPPAPARWATDPVDKNAKAATVLAEGPFDTTLSNNETTIEYHPTNPDIVIAGSNGSGGQRMSFSSDGGVTWGNAGALPGTCCDPAIEFSPDGNIAFAATLGQSGSGCGFSLCNTVYWSFNNGQNWLGPVHTSTASSDKEFIHVDKSPSSPYLGRLYATWHQSNVMQFARSTAMPVNGGSGLTFAPTQSFADEERGIGSDIATDRQGRVYYVYPSITSGSAEVRLLRSDDGGDTFIDMNGGDAGLSKMAYDLHGRFDFAIPAMESRRVFIYTVVDVDMSGGARDGRIYIAFTDENAAAGSPGNGGGSAAASHGWIQLVYSDDQGATWSVAATPHSTADQTTVDRFQPWMKVDSLGNVHIGWQDTRNSGSGLRDKADWYYAVSRDGGANWEEETRVSSVVSQNIANGQEWGDYNGLSVSPISDTVGMTWTDNRIITPPSTTSQRSFAAIVENVAAGPSYSMGTSASTFNLCAGDPVPDVSVQLAAAGGFTGLVTLSTPGLDNAVFPTATFTPNPIAPVEGGVSSVLAMTTNGAAPAGAYPISISSTNGGGTPIVRSDVFTVNVAQGVPTVATLSSPLDAAIGVSTNAVLAWDASPGAQEYVVEVSNTPTFVNAIAGGTVTGTTFTATGLEPDTEYFWRVRAVNACGDATLSTTRSFTTVAEICFDGSVAIPDNNTTGVDNTLNGFAGALLNLDVYVKIDHTYVGDVVVTLRHDAGAPVTLIDRPGVPTSTFGCSGDNVDVTLSDAGTAPVESTCGTTPPVVSGVLIPNATLSAFDGQDFAGAWVLNVSDRVGSDTGNLVRWCLLPSQAQASPDLIFEDGFE